MKGYVIFDTKTNKPVEPGTLRVGDSTIDVPSRTYPKREAAKVYRDRLNLAQHGDNLPPKDPKIIGPSRAAFRARFVIRPA